MKKLAIILCLSLVLSAVVIIPVFTAYAQNVQTKNPIAKGPWKHFNEHFSTQTTTYDDGAALERNVIKGPPAAPPVHERRQMPLLMLAVSVRYTAPSIFVGVSVTRSFSCRT